MDDDEQDSEESNEFVADPATLAQLDQEGAEFADQREQFAEMYGFDHDCHCAQDYADGKMAEVTECYLSLTDDALEHSAQLTWENSTLQGMVNTLVAMNDDLMGRIQELDENFDHNAVLQKALATNFSDEDLDADVTDSALERLGPGGSGGLDNEGNDADSNEPSDSPGESVSPDETGGV
jgi:hypothetical protein